MRELETQLSGVRGERLRIAFLIDGADKLRGEDTEQFFVHDSEQLLAIDAFVIYTAPLHLKYSGKLVGKLQDLVLPMIKLHERDGARCEAGWTALRELLARRIDPALFAEPALIDDLIGYCGGHPRELLRLLGLCCEVADDELIDRSVLDAAVKLLAADYRRASARTTTRFWRSWTPPRSTMATLKPSSNCCINWRCWNTTTAAGGAATRWCARWKAISAPSRRWPSHERRRPALCHPARHHRRCTTIEHRAICRVQAPVQKAGVRAGVSAAGAGLPR